MHIIAKSNLPITQRQAILHLTNVVKRNWTNKRRVHDLLCINEQTKENIKNGLV